MTSNKTIVMIHGFRGTHEGLALVAKQLESAYYLVTPDIPGFGEGETLDTYSLENYVSWLDRYMQQQNFDKPPILLGHSFGSIIAAAYASQHPSSIEQLVLMNPISAPALEGPKGLLTKLALAYYWLGRALPERAAHGWLSFKPIVYVMSVAMVKTKDKTLRRWIHQQHFTYFSRFHSPQSVSESFQASVENNVCDFAADIAVPTLVLAGEEDDIAPLDTQLKLDGLLPNGTLVVIPKVGHLTQYETPDQVAKAVIEFVEARSK